MKKVMIFTLLVLIFSGALWASHDEPPKVLQVKKTVGQVEQSGTAITLYTRLFGLDTPEGVNEFYSRFRLYDTETVAKADRSNIPQRAKEITKTKKYRAMYGNEITLTGEYFLITGPSHVTTLVEEKHKRNDNREHLQELLNAAESNYVAVTEKLLIGEFMDWSDYPAKIYVVPNVAMWLRLRSNESAESIVANCCVNDRSREFAILDDACDAEYVPQTLCYAISEQIVKEYCRVLSGRPDSKLPLFVMTGVAGELSGLEAVVTPPDFTPKQVGEVTIGGKHVKVKRPKVGKKLPLKEKRLVPFSELKDTQTLPQTPEQKYYFLYESRSVFEELWKNSPLGVLSLIRSLSQGRNFDKEFSLSYCEMQRGIIGTAVKEAKPGDTNVVVVGSADLKALEKASNRRFYELTQEKMTKDIIEAKKAKEKAAAEKAAEKGKGEGAEPAKEGAESAESAEPAKESAEPAAESAEPAKDAPEAPAAAEKEPEPEAAKDGAETPAADAEAPAPEVSESK